MALCLRTDYRYYWGSVWKRFGASVCRRRGGPTPLLRNETGFAARIQPELEVFYKKAKEDLFVETNRDVCMVELNGQNESHRR